MSWIRKIYAKLMSEEFIDNDNHHQPHHESNHKDQQPEMDTRITYQYPKGPVRFPLIQESSKERQLADLVTEAKNNEQTQMNPSVRKHEYVEKKSQKYMAESKQTNKHDQVDRKKEVRMNRPFRPSIIASPVHGFQRPNDVELEYELQDSFVLNQHDKKEEYVKDEFKVLKEDSIVLNVNIGSDVSNDPGEFQDNALEDIKLEMVEENKVLEKAEEEGNVQIVDEESVIQQENVTHVEETRPKERVRTHMPFNVLMLKQDRQNWQQQKEKHKNMVSEFEVKKTDRQEEYNELKDEEVRDTQVATPLQQTISKKEPDLEEMIYDPLKETTDTYQFPSFNLLHPPVVKAENKQWLEEQKELLNETLENFNVHAHVVHVSQGPSVTRFEVQPERGVKVSKITNLSDDIKLSMAAKDIRIEAPIPGKRSIGIEIPNMESRPVQISEIVKDATFVQNESPLTAVLGLDISGAPVVTDIRKMPHGLIAGATGSGKSVCINSILVSLLYKARPDELKLLLIDPKMVELAPYNHIPHLVSPVITDVKAATAALKWTVDEMERRYELFAHASVRDISRFNELAISNNQLSEKLPYIVVVIDELADLMMMAPTDVEESICRIAQKARACGIHLLIATQRPSVDVITGLIKANVPTRIAFSVSSQVDSRTIIDISGAEKLLGRGDMLFLGSGSSKPTRLQGTFVSDEEIDRIIHFVRTQGKPNYLFEQEELLKKAQIQEDEDELFLEACDFVVAQGSASTSLLQRHFRVGYNRAARLMEMMEQQGIISEARGSKARDVLINEPELELLKEKLVQ